jgi:hypothetical protein
MHIRSDFTVELSDEEGRTVDKNVIHLAEICGTTIRKCGNPACGYPLSGLQEYADAMSFGKVCDLCHAMFWAVKQRIFFVKAHEEEEKQHQADIAHKKKLLDEGGSYF